MPQNCIKQFAVPNMIHAISIPGMVLMSLVHLECAAQNDSTSNQSHEHHHNEIGLANALVFLEAEDEFAFGLHAHYLHAMGESNWSAGVGVERIFDEHGHLTFSGVIAFHPIEPLTLSASPGIATEGGNFNNGEFSLHLECVYEWELDDFHLGPMLEAAYEPEGMHYAIGLHLGVGF